MLQGKKYAGGSWENSQEVGTREKFVLEDRRLGLPDLESRQKQLLPWGQGKGRDPGSCKQGEFTSGKSVF